MVRTRRPIRLSRRRARVLRKLALLLVSLLILAPFLFPFAWMVMGSLKTQIEFTAYPPVWTFSPTLDNYQQVLTSGNFGWYTLNSTIIAGAATILSLLVGLPAAYVVARYRRSGLGVLLLVARMAPLVAFLIPLFVMYVKLHLVDTYAGLIAAHILVTLPLVVWMMVGFIEALPREIEEAARIDGAGMMSVLWRIVVPLTAPGTAAASILSFIFSWNNFLVSVVLSGSQTEPLTAAIFNYLGYESINWGPLCAAAAIVTVPVLVLGLVVQRYIVSGLVTGSVNG